MEPDHRLEGGDYLDLIEQPVLGWRIEGSVDGKGVTILFATLRASPPSGEHAGMDEPGWMKEATLALSMDDEAARSLLDLLQHHMSEKAPRRGP